MRAIDGDKLKAMFSEWEQIGGYSVGEKNILRAVINEIEDAEEISPAQPEHKWISVDEDLPKKNCDETWICFADGTVELDSWEGNRGEHGQWADGPIEERDFIKSGWWSYCDDSKNRITHWMPYTSPTPPKPYKYVFADLLTCGTICFIVGIWAGMILAA